eukprot:COSAG04_NODE_6_length_47123_cov_87.347482_11_plen_69_part_00
MQSDLEESSGEVELSRKVPARIRARLSWSAPSPCDFAKLDRGVLLEVARGFLLSPVGRDYGGRGWGWT